MTTYQMVQLLVIAAFALTIVDQRIPAGAVYLLPERIVKRLPVFYALALVILIWTVLHTAAVGGFEWAVLAISTLGTVITAVAKRQLGIWWTKAGMGFGSGRRLRVTTGLYRYIRHPMYTGIWLFALSTLALVWRYASLIEVVIATLAVGYILLFLAVCAWHEDARLPRV